MIKKGRYKHYKGKEYLVLCVTEQLDAQIKGLALAVATHTEENRHVYIYSHNEKYVTCLEKHDYVIYGDKDSVMSGRFWARPLVMFESKVIHEGVEVDRFEYIGEII